MSEINIEVRFAIEQLVTEHNWLADHGHFDQLWKLYTEDGQSTGPMGTMTGREAIRTWGAKRASQTGGLVRHIHGGLRLAYSGEILHGTVYYLAFRDTSDNPLIPASVGEFIDEYAQVDGKWLIRSRQVTPVLGAQNAAAHQRRLSGESA